MGLIKVVIPDDLEEELRQVVPARKGALSKFVSDAIREKIQREKQHR